MLTLISALDTIGVMRPASVATATFTSTTLYLKYFYKSEIWTALHNARSKSRKNM